MSILRHFATKYLQAQQFLEVPIITSIYTQLSITKAFSVAKHGTKYYQQDPHQAREAQQYANPVPSREFILDTIRTQGGPLSFNNLIELLQIEPERQTALSYRVKAMLRDGQLMRNRRGGLCIVNQKDLITGRVIGHADGFGFLKPDTNGDDLFLSPREMHKVWPGDRVVAQISGVDRRGRYTGAIIEVLEHTVHHLVGRLSSTQGITVLLPDNKRIAHQVLIPPDQLGAGQDGQIVVVEILQHPGKRCQPIGRVREILGNQATPGMYTDIAIRSHDLPVEWPADVEQEIVGLTPEVPASAKAGRTDLRHLPFVTIDGADAKDYDDAVYCQATPKGWRLLVAIADVSAYVAPQSALDRAAYQRSTSAYFPDRVLPMLPEILSNGLCSLNPQVDRLCLVAELYINQQGTLYRSRFQNAVIHSHARLTYDQAQTLLSGDDTALCTQYAALLPALHALYALYRVLRHTRAERGAIDFDTTETYFRFDPSGHVIGIEPLVRNEAHRIIEECMLTANVAAARYLIRKKIPTLYRVHERPNPTKLTDITRFLHTRGLHLGGSQQPTTKDYADLLNMARDRADFPVIQIMLLRSMMQAVYTANNKGHFGLAFPAYTHFTSPIRRYPDLMVHRAIKHGLLQEDTSNTAGDFAYSHQAIAVMGEHCSTLERKADEAARDATDALKCAYMQDKIGATFRGIISGVHNFGLFVELDTIHVSGLIHITALDKDYFHFDPIQHRLSGERSGKQYNLGDTIQVQLAAVDTAERRIDFILAATSQTKQHKGHL